jgi:cell division protein FtsB
MKKLISLIISKLSLLFTPTRIGVAALSGLFFWFLVTGDQGVIKLKRLIEMKSNLLAERGLLNFQIDLLSKKKTLLSDPSNLELAIRKELGYVRPGEMIFEEKAPEVFSRQPNPSEKLERNQVQTEAKIKSKTSVRQ